MPEGDPLVVGIDETLERRYGQEDLGQGRLPRSGALHPQTFVKSSGLRWVCVMLLVEIPWASRVWALPFLSALAPSERYAARAGQTTQEDNRVGLAAALGGKALVPTARDRGRGRSRLRIAQAARSLPQA